MSAGDVLFIGWKGGSPNYKELRPAITYEPSRDTDTIRKRATIKRICFDADKQAVIQQLPFDNATITSTYIDANGAIASVSLGGGWNLLNVDDAQYKTGFSIITAVYEKTIARVLELGLPENLTITCASGIASIKYLTHELEQFDSGTGACGAGLELVGSATLPPIPSDLRYAELGPSRSYQGGFQYFDSKYTPLYRGGRVGVYEFRLNGVYFDRTVINVEDLPYAVENTATITNDETTESVVWYDIRETELRMQSLSPSWSRVGNVIRLTAYGAVLREYDITGLA